MRWDHKSSIVDDTALREPIFNAMDELRLALDHAVEIGDDRIAGLLLITLHDLADTVELTLDDPVCSLEPSWTVTDTQGP